MNIVANEPQNDLQNESSENDDDWSTDEDELDEDEPSREIECRRCNRNYISGILFVRTTCGHLTCLTCMWEYATNFGKDNCPICGAVIDHMDSIHVTDLAFGQLKFRTNNHN